VYDNYDPTIHLIDRFPIPAGWRRFRVVDFGYTNPFVCQWWALDDDGRLYRYRELYATQRLVSDHAGDISRLSAGESYVATVADHDAEDRATLHAAGIPTVPAYKSVTVGIQAVQDRLRPAGDGKPRLFLLRDSLVSRDERLVEAKKPLCTEQEIDGYVWTKTADGRPVKEEPVKVDDHGVDAMRYAVAWADGLGVVKVGAY
jgi:phage terminase large subunit